MWYVFRTRWSRTRIGVRVYVDVVCFSYKVVQNQPHIYYYRCAPWWLLPRRAGNCDCLYRVAIAYIGLHLCRELHLSMVVLCLRWCICLWWYHICVLVYAETAVAPAKMRYSICRPGMFFAHGQSKPKPKPNRRPGAFLHMGNWGSSVCRPGVFSVQAAPVVEDWGPSVCRPGVFSVQAAPEPRAYGGGRLGSECM